MHFPPRWKKEESSEKSKRKISDVAVSKKTQSHQVFCQMITMMVLINIYFQSPGIRAIFWREIHWESETGVNYYAAKELVGFNLPKLV